MNGTKPFPVLIAPDEAIKLYTHATTYEMHIAKELYEHFKESSKSDTDTVWGFFRLLSFIYYTGRVQGIREEREKRKA